MLTAQRCQVMDVVKRLRPLLFEPKHTVIKSGTLGLLKPNPLIWGLGFVDLTFRDPE